MIQYFPLYKKDLKFLHLNNEFKNKNNIIIRMFKVKNNYVENILSKKYLTDKEKYEELWKKKYNVVIPKKNKNQLEKIIKFIES